MIIEIKGTGNHNKGAEMMLLTILQEFRSDNIEFAVTPNQYSCGYEFYSRLGIHPKIWFTFKGIQLGNLGRLIPKRIRSLYGMITDQEVDVVLDASGFAYSSQWGELPAKQMAKDTKRWRRMNKKIILLPQSFGPFETEQIKGNMYEIVNNSDLIYARDEYSYHELKKITNNSLKIKQSPDFTTLFHGVLPDYYDKDRHQVCIVPNQRMKDKEKNADIYEEVYAKLINKVQQNELSPFFLIHGGEEDYLLAQNINDLLGDNKIEIIYEENPYYIKGIISESKALIGSRYHSIASALYSAVPSLGTGWSHKYRYLFKDFEYPEGLMELNISEKELSEKISLITNESNRAEITNRLIKQLRNCMEKNQDMFKEIKNLIGIL